MSEALKFIGGGSMQKGIAKIALSYKDEGVREGFRKGLSTGINARASASSGDSGGLSSLVLGGVVATTFLFFVIDYLIKEEIKNDKNLTADGETILNNIEGGFLSRINVTDSNDSSLLNNGRKLSLSEEKLQCILKIIRKQPNITYKEIIKELSLPLSEAELCTIINNELGLIWKKMI